MNIEEGNHERGVTSGQYPPHNGTFQGCANYPPQPAMGFPPPSQPSNAAYSSAPPSLPQSYAPGNQTGQGPGYPVAEERPAVREHDRLPFCGCGVGWFLFILGFFVGAITWYVGAIMLLCVRRRLDSREKSGYIACTISAVIATILIILGATTRFHW